MLTLKYIFVICLWHFIILYHFCLTCYALIESVNYIFNVMHEYSYEYIVCDRDTIGIQIVFVKLQKVRKHTHTNAYTYICTSILVRTLVDIIGISELNNTTYYTYYYTVTAYNRYSSLSKTSV